jgi:hypothetical protein
LDAVHGGEVEGALTRIRGALGSRVVKCKIRRESMRQRIHWPLSTTPPKLAAYIQRWLVIWNLSSSAIVVIILPWLCWYVFGIPPETPRPWGPHTNHVAPAEQRTP